MPRVQHIKANRAALVAKAAAGLLLPGEIYLIKDDSPKTLAIATSTTTFDEYYNKSQVNSSVASVLPSQTGNSGKFLTTNGTATSWGSLLNLQEVRILNSTSNSAPSTLDCASGNLFWVERYSSYAPLIDIINQKAGENYTIVIANNYMTELSHTIGGISFTLPAVTVYTNTRVVSAIKFTFTYLFGKAFWIASGVVTLNSAMVAPSYIALERTSRNRTFMTFKCKINTGSSDGSGGAAYKGVLLGVQGAAFPSLDSTALSNIWTTSANLDYSLAPEIATGVKLLARGMQNSLDGWTPTVTGLTRNTAYSFALLGYAYDNGIYYYSDTQATLLNETPYILNNQKTML